MSSTYLFTDTISEKTTRENWIHAFVKKRTLSGKANRQNKNLRSDYVIGNENCCKMKLKIYALIMLIGYENCCLQICQYWSIVYINYGVPVSKCIPLWRSWYSGWETSRAKNKLLANITEMSSVLWTFVDLVLYRENIARFRLMFTSRTVLLKFILEGVQERCHSMF